MGLLLFIDTRKTQTLVVCQQKLRYSTSCMYVTPKKPKPHSYILMNPNSSLQKISQKSPFPLSLPVSYSILKKKLQSKYSVTVLQMQMHSMTTGRLVLLYHWTHRKMSNNFTSLLLCEYQAAYHKANLKTITTKLGFYKFSSCAPFSFVNILSVCLPKRQVRCDGSIVILG